MLPSHFYYFCSFRLQFVKQVYMGCMVYCLLSNFYALTVLVKNLWRYCLFPCISAVIICFIASSMILLSSIYSAIVYFLVLLSLSIVYSLALLSGHGSVIVLSIVCGMYPCEICI